MRALLFTLALAACTDHAAPLDAPTPASTPEQAPRPLAVRRTAPPTPPRLVREHVHDFGLFPDGTLLVLDDDRTTSLFDPDTGATRPWRQPLQLTTLGWRIDEFGQRPEAVTISPDGRWVALTIAFTPRGERSSNYAFVVTRSDGSDPRCVGVTHYSPSVTFTVDSTRVVGNWPAACKPTPRGRIRFREPNAWRQRWFDVRDGARGDAALRDLFPEKDPRSDTALVWNIDNEHDGPDTIEFIDFVTGAELGRATLPGRFHRVLAWIQPDAAYVLHDRGTDDPSTTRSVVFADGRVIPDLAPRRTFYTHLPNGEVLFNEHAVPPNDSYHPEEVGRLHQARIDWQTLTVLDGIPRDDLAGRTRRMSYGPLGPLHYTWTPTPAGLLIHEHRDGRLELAGL